MSKNHPEYALQKLVCGYLNSQFPKVLYYSDTIAAVSLTPMQGKRNKAIQKHGFKVPDILVLKPNGKYYALFLELKIETPFKKNGEIKASKDDHLEGQQETINQLNGLNYFACFCWTFDQAKQIIDDYMKLM